MIAECVGLIQACKAAKVKHIVKCIQGSLDADNGLYELAEWNRQIEDALKTSGVSYPMYNISGQYEMTVIIYVIVRHAHFFTTLRIFTETYVKLYRYLLLVD